MSALCVSAMQTLDSGKDLQKWEEKNCGCGHGVKQYTSYLRGDL
jgi:hypothetical protein